MNPLLFRTAVPLGYMGFAALLLVVFTAGAFIALRGWRARRRGQSAVGAVMLTLAVAVAWVNIAEKNELDLNPQFPSSAVLGVWKDGATTLVLLQDGAYRCSGTIGCGGLGQGGTWTRDGDFELRFRHDPAAPEVGRRVVAYRGELCLATLFEDIDSWDGRLSFHHAASAY